MKKDKETWINDTINIIFSSLYQLKVYELQFIREYIDLAWENGAAEQRRKQNENG